MGLFGDWLSKSLYEAGVDAPGATAYGRKLQEEKQKALWDTINKDMAAAKQANASNDLLDSVRQFDDLDPENKTPAAPAAANNFTFAEPMDTQLQQPQKYGFANAVLSAMPQQGFRVNAPAQAPAAATGQVQRQPQAQGTDPAQTQWQPQQRPILADLVSQSGALSLLPAAQQAAPKYDQATLYSLVQQAVKNGADPKMALQVIGGYVSGNREEQDKTQREAAFDAYISKLPPEQQNIVRAAVKFGIPGNVLELMNPKKPNPVSLGNGGRLVDPNTGKVIMENPYTERPLTAFERYRIEQGLVGGGGGGRSGGSSRSSSKVNGITERQYNAALGEVARFRNWETEYPDANGMDYPYKEKYWNARRIVDQYNGGGSSDQGGSGSVPPQNRQPAQPQESGAAWYDREWRKLIDNHGYTPELATQYMTEWIQRNGG